jgi:hypothetical protein
VTRATRSCEPLRELDELSCGLVKPAELVERDCVFLLCPKRVRVCLLAVTIVGFHDLSPCRFAVAESAELAEHLSLGPPCLDSGLRIGTRDRGPQRYHLRQFGLGPLGEADFVEDHRMVLMGLE